ncbi:MAG: hypothetical protein NT091_03280, partial [Candidatus Falkowbacteria bacterium]|nr:hypothetical protein [Candidatus Falkowbacteria bacterium]
MARLKQSKEYKKNRLKEAKSLILQEFGAGSFKELRKKYALYQGKSDKQSEIVLFLLEKGFNFSEIGKLSGKSHETIRKMANKTIEHEHETEDKFQETPVPFDT